MKEALYHLSKVVLGIVLILVSLILFIVIVPFAAIWKFIVSITEENRKARDILSSTANFFIDIAASFDQLGNACFGGFLNWCFLDDANLGYSFGDKDDTISEVLGWNEQYGNVNKRGRILIELLNKLDKNHCEKAMYSGIDKADEKMYRYNTLNE